MCNIDPKVAIKEVLNAKNSIDQCAIPEETNEYLAIPEETNEYLVNADSSSKHGTVYTHSTSPASACCLSIASRSLMIFG